MLKKWFLVSAAVVMAGCASAPSDKPTDSSEPAAVSSPGANEVKDEPSQVLNKNKKCPRKSKMVNGKCMLQVETTE